MRKFLITHPAFFRASFVVSFVTTIGLFVAGFVMPPAGDITPNVLKGGAILLAFAVIAAMPDIIRSARSVTFRHGDTEATIETTGNNKVQQLTGGDNGDN